jgi:hypothetical protein
VNSRAAKKHFIYIARAVAERYYEIDTATSVWADGCLSSSTRVIELRVDIGRVLGRLPRLHQQLLAAVHRDGLTQADAVKQSGLGINPESLFERIEAPLGEELERLGLHEIVGIFK